MSNTTHITEALKDLILKDDRAFVAMLSGEWGIGKTYFWKQLLTKEELKSSKRSITYISLFGYTSIQNIKNDIVLKLSKAETTKAVFSEVFQGFRTSLGAKDGDESTNLNLSGSLISSALSLIPEKSLKGSVICFDDFERLSDKVSLKDVMGLISQFKEQKECKVIMILNEKELDKLSDIDGKKHDEIFTLYKEKVVDYNFHYLPSQEELFQAMKEDIDNITYCEPQTILDFFEKIDLKNIRIMQQALYLLGKFSFIQSKKYDKKVIDEFVEIALNLFVFKAKSNYTYIEFHDMQEYISNDWSRDIAKEENRTTDLEIDEKHEINRLHYHTEDKFFSNHYYSHNKDTLENNIYNFITTHTIKKEELENILNKNNQSLSWYDTRAKICEINKRFITDFSTSNNELSIQLFTLIHEYRNDMHRLFRYSGYEPFIKDINEFAPEILTKELETEIAKKYLDFYISSHDHDNYGLLDNSSEIDLIISNYAWAEEYKNTSKQNILKVDPNNTLSLIENVLKTRYLSEDIAYTLNQVSAKDYKILIKENSNFIQPLIKFLNMPDTKDIRTNIINALKSLKNESKDYAWKVNRIAKSMNIDLEEDK